MSFESDSAILNPGRAESLFGQVMDAAGTLGVRDVEVMIGAGATALTRFANNAIHQNVAERTAFVSVRLQMEGRTARAATNRLTGEGMRAVVEEAAAITRVQEPDPDLPPMAAPARASATPRWFGSTARLTPAARAQAVAEAVATVEAAGQTSAGIYSSGENVLALLNSHGASAYHAETMAQFSITSMAPESSGWAKAGACCHEHFDPARLARTAVRKAGESRDPVELAPGRYTVILEPAAVLDLLGQMFGDFSATAIRDGRSFLQDRLGKRLFGENITIEDDVTHPLGSGAPFDGEGVPRKGLTLVERGVVKEIAYGRQAARLAGVEPTGHGFPVPNEIGEAPMNIVVAGGQTPLEEMIASTPRGILLTRVWYIREVDPYQKIMTGMTRDGTFLVEGGEIVRGVRNFRFNQSLIELLANVEALSGAVRTSGEESFDMVVPAMKVRDFHFTEVTRF